MKTFVLVMYISMQINGGEAMEFVVPAKFFPTVRHCLKHKFLIDATPVAAKSGKVTITRTQIDCRVLKGEQWQGGKK